VSETITADMIVFARVAGARSFTAAARALGMPKQTVSRRIAELERRLGVQLLHRTTRRVMPTDAGALFAARCAEIARLAEEATRAVSDNVETPRGTLRITADPAFGDAFLSGLVVEYARRWPEVGVDVVLTRRRIDLIDEGIDLAFRVGKIDDPSLVAKKLGPARVRYCASPEYVARRGAPRTPSELRDHECVIVGDASAPARWPFRIGSRDVLVPVQGRIRVSSFAMAHAAVLGGLGIGIFPEYACAKDVREGRLVPMLDDLVVDVGGVWLVYPAQRLAPARVRAFVELAIARLRDAPPWVVPQARRPAKRRTSRR
jgi:DNA-binding transcriptional LysR family regulator